MDIKAVTLDKEPRIGDEYVDVVTQGMCKLLWCQILKYDRIDMFAK